MKTYALLSVIALASAGEDIDVAFPNNCANGGGDCSSAECCTFTISSTETKKCVTSAQKDSYGNSFTDNLGGVWTIGSCEAPPTSTGGSDGNGAKGLVLSLGAMSALFFSM